MRIRPAEEADFCQIHRLMEQVHTLHVAAMPAMYCPADPLPKAHFEKLLQGDGFLLVAQADANVVGYAMAYLRITENKPAHTDRVVLFVDDVVVDENLRRQGIGTALMETLSDIGRKRGAASMELMVHSFNQPAIRFYRDAGMTERSYVMQKKL